MRISSKNNLTRLSSSREIFNSLLESRGLSTKKDKLTYLNPPPPSLDMLVEDLELDLFVLKGIKDRIQEAINSQEKICIYGDYDTDGVTASSILYRTLSLLKATVLPFIPHREKHGYGMSESSINEILSGEAFAGSPLHPFKPTLIITVDNGIVAHEEVANLKEKGIDVIITDHHQVEGYLPTADHILHSTISSASVLAWTLSLYLSHEDVATQGMIDLATVGLIADQLPLTGINRNIAKHGLLKMRTTSNKGLKSLIKISGVENKDLTSYDVGFLIAPRINAAGRLSSATEALRLLCTDNASQADALASSLDSINSERQIMTNKALSAIKEEPRDGKLITLVSDAYNEGIIGLIAGKILEETGKPAVVITTAGAVAKGSARAPKGINITDILRKAKSLTLSLGGHAAAAGFSIDSKNIDAFISRITNESESIDDTLLIKSVFIDAELLLSQLTLELAKLISTLEPFGIGNPRPKFMTSSALVIDSERVGDARAHLRLTLESNGKSHKAIWFNAPDDIENNLNSGDFIYTISVNNWNNREYLNIVISYAEKT